MWKYQIKFLAYAASSAKQTKVLIVIDHSFKLITSSNQICRSTQYIENYKSTSPNTLSLHIKLPDLLKYITNQRNQSTVCYTSQLANFQFLSIKLTDLQYNLFYNALTTYQFIQTNLLIYIVCSLDRHAHGSRVDHNDEEWKCCGTVKIRNVKIMRWSRNRHDTRFTRSESSFVKPIVFIRIFFTFLSTWSIETKRFSCRFLLHQLILSFLTLILMILQTFHSSSYWSTLESCPCLSSELDHWLYLPQTNPMQFLCFKASDDIFLIFFRSYFFIFIVCRQH